jgi:hypothetical protein
MHTLQGCKYKMKGTPFISSAVTVVGWEMQTTSISSVHQIFLAIRSNVVRISMLNVLPQKCFFNVKGGWITPHLNIY